MQAEGGTNSLGCIIIDACDGVELCAAVMAGGVACERGGA